MPTTNEALQDEDVRHSVYFHRYSNGVVRRIIALLNRVDADLFAQLTTALAALEVAAYTVERLEALLFSVRRLNADAYRAVERELDSEIHVVAAYEAAYQRSSFTELLPVQVTVNAVSADAVYAAAMSRPFQGRLLKEWASTIEADRMVRIRDAVRVGFVEGQTTSQIVRRIRGTRSKGYSDGIIEIDRRHAEAVVRTALSHTAATAREQFDSANTDLIKGFVWTSTLDTRTTPQCRIRDGKQYDTNHRPVGHKIPWLSGPGKLHWNCRSSSTRVVKSWRELGLDVDEIPPGTRASMDGQVPADMSYGEWLRKQPADRQDDILGPSRGKLLREGGLDFDRFHNDKGKWLSLDEIRQRDAEAFRRAKL